MTLPVLTEAAAASPQEAPHHSRSRSRGIAAAGLTALFGKGIGLLVSAATIPLTVRYLGAEGYGLWITISSAATMFFLLDIGIANTLTNLISEAYAANDKKRAATYFTTAFWVVVGISVLLGLLGWILWPFIPWVSLFHVQNPALAKETSHAMAAAFIVFLMALPTSLASKVLGGYQELHASNLFTAAGSVLSLLVVVAVIHFHGNLTFLVAGFAGSTVAANAACLLWICLFHKPWMKPWPRRISRGSVGRIFRSGSQFFVLQLAGLVVFNSDNIVISHYLSPSKVTPYAITFRLVGYILTLQTLITPALWPAYAEAYAKGHLSWIRLTYNRVRWISVAGLTVGCSITLFLGREIIRVWAGPQAVPSQMLITLMCLWIVLLAFATNQSCLMGATYRIGKQAIAAVANVLVNLTLSIIWVKTMGTNGVILATIVSVLIFIVGVQAWQVKKILRGDFLRDDEAVTHQPSMT